MIKTIITLVVIAVFGIISSVNATPIDTGVDTGAEYLVLTDTDGTNDSIFTMTLQPLATSLNPWAIGIYGFTTDGDGNTTIGEMLSVLTYDSLSYSKVAFDLENGTATNTTTTSTVNIGINFGIYFEFGDELDDNYQIWYTHFTFNVPGVDYFSITGGDNCWDAQVACDLFTLGVNDASAAPVPEPATILLLGSGLLGLAGISRKKILKS